MSVHDSFIHVHSMCQAPTDIVLHCTIISRTLQKSPITTSIPRITRDDRHKLLYTSIHFFTLLYTHAYTF
jgi:hypothetical protein